MLLAHAKRTLHSHVNVDANLCFRSLHVVLSGRHGRFGIIQPFRNRLPVQVFELSVTKRVNNNVSASCFRGLCHHCACVHKGGRVEGTYLNCFHGADVGAILVHKGKSG